MRVAVVGAGAVGGWMAARLAMSGVDVSVLARGDTLTSVQRDGLALREDGATHIARVRASDQADVLGAHEIVIVALKSPALRTAAPQVQRLCTPETTIVPAMNGILWWFTHGMDGPLRDTPLKSADPDSEIRRHIPPSQVLGCVVHIASKVAAPGHIVHDSGRDLIIGEPAGGESERLARCAHVLSAAGFEIAVSPRIHQEVWCKLFVNMTFNPISVLTRATMDRIVDDPLVRPFVLAVMGEAAEVGQRIGCTIPQSGEERLKLAHRFGAFKTSMLQDAERCRPLEIDTLLAAPREIAAIVGVPTPAMDALHGLIRLYTGSKKPLSP